MTLLKKIVFRAACLIGAVGTAVVLVALPAQASTGTQVPVGSASGEGCTFTLLGTWNTPNYWTAARITAASGIFGECEGWLERSTNGGASYSIVSSIHTEQAGQSVTTYNYWDGNGDLSRACGFFDGFTTLAGPDQPSLVQPDTVIADPNSPDAGYANCTDSW